MQGVNSALITAAATVFVGFLTFMGVIITNSRSNKSLERKLEIAQAITDTKIEELTREVRIHNNFAVKIPVLEEQIKHLVNGYGTSKKGGFYEQPV
jgi:hypothetical protein